MPFKRRDMRIMINGSPTVWSYFTEDTATKVLKRNYFDDFKEKLAVGDWIMSTTSTGGLILHVDEIDPLEVVSTR